MSIDPAELFEQALARPPEARAAYLREATGGDETLIAEIRSLLDAHERHPHLLAPGTPAVFPPGGDEEPESVPERIGPYRVEGVLGRGGMGRVYEATDTRTGERVALKMLATGPRGDAFRGTLEREARALVSLDHPCIVSIRAVDAHADALLLVLPVERGQTLAARLAAGPLDTESALRTGRRIALALEAAHARGVEHLDLKPANVIVGEGCSTRVVDFGLARHAGGDRAVHPSPGRPTAGTPGYMSPEQITGEPGSARSDLFALGCILFESLTGTPPFTGATTGEILRATRERAPAWSALPPEVATLHDTLRACLARDPAARPESARAVRRAITRTIAATGGTDAPEDTGDVSLPPLPADALIGRDLAREHLACLLDDGDSVSLVGTGGCGKTRLALDVAHAVASGRADIGWRPEATAFVALAPVRDEALVARSVATVLGVRETRDGDLFEAIAMTIGERDALLVLDNVEHVVDACRGLVSSLRSACPRLRVVVTGREPLGADREVTFRVRPLDVPRPGAEGRELLASDAARLLVDRAGIDDAAARSHAGNIGTICRRVGGIPLGIELVARAFRDADPGAIAEGLERASHDPEDDGDLGDASAPAALRDLLEWSHARLTPESACVFRRLSVFRGTWTRDAAIDVLADGALARDAIARALVDLADRCLIEREPAPAGATGTDAVRFRFLEPVRAYAAERLVAAGERHSLDERHRLWYADLGIHASPLLRGPEQREWLGRLDADIDNLRAALESYGATASTDDNRTRTHALRLAAGLGQFWLVRGYWSEGRRHYARLLALPLAGSRSFANTVTWDGNLALHAGDLDDAVERYAWATELGEALGDDEVTARAVTNLGVVYIFRRDLDAAREALTRGLAMQRSLGHDADAATTELNLGVVAEWSGELTEARARYTQSLAIRRRLGDRAAEASALNNLGAVAEKQGDLDAAAACHDTALDIRRDIGDRRGIAESLRNRGAVATLSGRAAGARADYEESLGILREITDVNGTAETLEALAALLVDTDPERALAHLVEAEALRERCGIDPPPAREAARGETAAQLEARLGAEAVAAARRAART